MPKVPDHPFQPSEIPSKLQPRFQNVIVTPETAREALARIAYIGENKKPSNVRGHSQNRSATYAQDMKEHDWRVTGDTIRFDTEGRLIDGAHRLHAVVTAGVSVEMSVATNVPDDAFHGIDVGSSKTAGQIVGYQGTADADQVCAVIRWVIWYNRSMKNKGAMIKGLATTVAQVEHGLRSHPNIPQSVRATSMFRGLKPALIPWSTAGFVHYMGSRTSPEAADDFIDQLVNQGETKRFAPTRVLRDWIIQHRILNNNHLNRWAACWMTVMTWLCFEEGSSGQGITFSKGVILKPFQGDQ